MPTALDSTADELAGQILDSSPSRPFIVSGGPGTGKTQVLELASERLADAGLKPICLSPGIGDIDAPAAALMGAASGFGTVGAATDAQLRAWREPRSFDEHLNDLRSWTEALDEPTVLLLDEPDQWAQAAVDAESRRGLLKRAAAVAGVLQNAPCRRVISTAVPVTRSFALGGHWLDDLGDWGMLQPTVDSMSGERVIAQPATPLECRLMVALATVAGVDAVRSVPPQRRRADVLARRLAEAAKESRDWRPLFGVWRLVAAARGPVPRDWFGDVIADLDDLVRDVFLRAVVATENGTLRMHEALRAVVRGASPGQPAHAEEAMTRLAERYLEQYEGYESTGDPRSLNSAAEALFFHAQTARLEGFDRVGARSSEQYDALGFELSYHRHRFGDAAEAFRSAIEIDPDDDYAHHYLAYNLDRDARQPTEVEAHYRRAVELDPMNVWWHSRLVSFLVVRGRIDIARTAWDEAQEAISPDPRRSPSQVWDNLHLWVAATLLRRAQLDFARDVLEDVPGSMRPELPRWEELWERLLALEEAERGTAFVPIERLRPGWWLDGPDLLQDRLGDGRRLVRWIAGRVDSVDEEGVHLQVAEVVPGRNRTPGRGRMTVPPDVFEAACRDRVSLRELQPDRHVEIGLFAGQQAGPPEMLLRVHHDRPPEPPRTQLDPDRYLRRRGWL